MSVLSTLDFQTGTWSFDVYPESFSPYFEIGFKEGEKPALSFKNLSFGFSVELNNLQVFSKSYPAEGVRYVATDQVYLTNDRLDLAPDDQVTLSVWAKNDGKHYESEVFFVIPRPQKPHPSWLWSDGAWIAPVPYPEDGHAYEWSEEELDWATVGPIDEQGDD